MFACRRSSGRRDPSGTIAATFDALFLAPNEHIYGLGEQFVRSIFEKDFPVIMGTTILYSVFFVASYLLQDILYGIIDPRIRVAGNRE